MPSQKNIKSTQIIGIIATIASIVIFVLHPSFPTPDKLFIFMLFVFMIFSQGWRMTKRLGPFVVVILVYESFRSIADTLNQRVNFNLAPDFDKRIFGKLPTQYLQDWLWRGHTNWYDYALYIPYMLFFVVPLALALLVWKTREKVYWSVVGSYMILFFASFITFALFPAAPPWMASNFHVIPHIERISSFVWAGLGIKDFPSLYNHITANPVAAVPSLHSAAAVLFSIWVFKLYGKKLGLISSIYPLLIFIGVIYEGEHYAFDVILGATYAAVAYKVTPKFIELSATYWLKLMNSNSTKSALRSARKLSKTIRPKYRRGASAKKRKA